MRFREFQLLSEFDHYSLESPQMINGVKCNGIDFRFEDWTKGLNPSKSSSSSMEIDIMPPPKRFILSGSYRAPCKEGWLVIDKRSSDSNKQSIGGLGLATQAVPDIQVIQQINPEVEELLEMPKSWFRYAVLYMGNNVVKEPEWPRGEYEMIKKQGQIEKKPNQFRIEN